MKLAKFLLSLIVFVSINFAVNAQDPLGGRDLSQVKVEALTDNQIQEKYFYSGGCARYFWGYPHIDTLVNHLDSAITSLIKWSLRLLLKVCHQRNFQS